MQIASRFLAASLAAAVIASVAPAAAQTNRYPLIRNLLHEDQVKRDAAVGRCAASIAPTLVTNQPSTPARPTFEIIGFQYRNNGDLRIFGSASAGEFGKPVDFSCDIDPSGNLRKLVLATTN